MIRTVLKGVEKAVKDLEKAEKKIKTKIVRKAVTAGGQIMLKAERATAPKQHGFLRKSLSKKIKTYRNSNVTVAIVGPRSKKEYSLAGKKIKPSKYAHLVERGTKHTTASWFMARAYANSQGAATEKAVQIIKEEIEREYPR